MDIVQDNVVEQVSTPSNPVTDERAEESPLPGVDVAEAESAPEPKEDPIPRGVQKRIDRAIKRQYEAEGEARALRERVAAMESRQFAPQQRQAQQDQGEPTIDQFENFDEYVAAKAEYIADKRINSTLSAREQQQRAAYEAAERSKTVESWNKRMMQATAEMPDFEEVLSSSELPMTSPMQQAIMESDVGPKLAYYLATHPDEAVSISGMSPTGAIRALGRLEERLSSQKPAVKSTDAPAPITPVGNRAAAKKDPGKMSDAEYEKWRKTA